jgi:serralysin
MRSIGRFVALVIGCCCAGVAVPARAQIVSPITGQNAPIVACFAPGERGEADWEYVRAVQNYVNAANAPFMFSDYYLGGRWPGNQGTPRSLTWSFVPDGTPISGGIGEPAGASNLFAQMDANFAGQGGRATWISRFTQMFTRWSEVAGVTFTRVTSGGNDWDDGAGWGSGSSATRGDIRISMHFIDGNAGANVLAYCAFPISGDMVLDSANIGEFASSSNQNRFLRDVVTHELGHGLGLQHVCSSNTNQLMEPFINTAFDGPMQDDIRGLQRHYGDPKESNDSAATATTLGTLNPSGTLTMGALPAPLTGGNDPNAALLSIDGAGKTDWFVFNASASMNVTVTVTPVGISYDSTAQAANGTCPSGTTVNAGAIANLSVDVYASNGTTLVASSNTAAAGAAEVLSNVSLGSGPCYVRVTASNSPVESQLYKLSVTSTCATAEFIQHPLTQTVNVRTPMTLQGDALGATSYRWRKNGVDLSDDGRVSGSTTDTLQISSTVMADAGSYTLAATNGCGVGQSNPATVTIVCYANCDASVQAPVLNVGDFGCFVTRFSEGSPYANCDGSTTPPVLNALDFSCFLQRFTAGCP